MKRIKYLSLTAALALCLTACAPRSVPEPKSQVGFYFDTVVTMTAYTDDDALLSDALAECGRYERLLSKTVEGSDVWNINHAGGRRTPVSPETREILEKAVEYSRLSDGAFDVTIEPCVALWDFSEDAAPALPDPAALAAAAARVDWTRIDLSDDGVLLPDGMTIDLGAIAKGYITDKIAQLFRDRGVSSGYLNFGGNVFTIGRKPDGRAWNIGIQDPLGLRDQSIVGSVAVADQAVVTSGIYERGFDLDGVRYHHILDPATGSPVQNELAGVSIISDNAFDADALSTTVFTLGAEKGAQLIESLPGTDAVFVTRDDRVSITSGLEDIFTPPA